MCVCVRARARVGADVADVQGMQVLVLYTCALSLIFFKYFNKEIHVPSSSTWNLRKSFFFYRGMEIGIDNRVILLVLTLTTEFLV